MSTAWQELGFVRLPLSFSVLVLVLLVGWTSVKVFGRNASPDARTKVWIDAILFWGGFAAITGILGTLVGITLAAQSIEQAGEISTTLLWGGVKVALVSADVGLLIALLAALLWFLLRLRWRFLRTALLVALMSIPSLASAQLPGGSTGMVDLLDTPTRLMVLGLGGPEETEITSPDLCSMRWTNPHPCTRS